MTPLRLSHIWHRRLYMAIFLIALSLVTIYGLDYFGVYSVREMLRVNTLTAVLAATVMVASLVFIFIEKKLSGFGYSFGVFVVLTLALGWQIAQTDGITSPYLILWAFLSLFAALFGAYGWVFMTILIGCFIAGSYLSGDLDFETMTIITLGSILPLVTGIIVWREQGEIDDSTKNVKNLANQLSEIASKSEIVINAIGDGVIAIDSTATIQLINPAAQVILGWGKQDALKLSYKSILKLEDENGHELDSSINPIEQVLNTNQQSRANHLIALTSSGKKISVSVVVTPIGDAGSGAIIVFRDITNERAEEREQAEFISTASHEMRTPVAAIEGYLGLAINPNTASVDARAKDFIMKAHEAAQHLGHLFQDLLDVSKTDDGRLTNVPKVVDLGNLTETIVQGLTEKATTKGLRLIYSAANTASANSSQKKIMPVYYVNQDNDHIREILDNLIENAIKYTPQGEVVVDINGDEDKVIVSIKDSGLGIPPEDIPHLFQKFYRVSNMDRQEIGGTGLGLYLVRRLTENMQGRVWVESIFGQGSTFFFQLPRVDTQEAEHLKEEQQARAAQQQTAQPAAPVTTIDQIPASNAVPVPYAAPAPIQAPMQAPVAVPTFAAQPPQALQPAPVAAPAVLPVAPVQAAPAPTNARPATTVPRGESLTREQINERVKQLEALAQQQRGESGR
jgi:PAS domain S-box-containing protein